MISNFPQASADERIRGVELEGALIGVDGVGHLIVARFVERSEIEPDFGEVGVNSDRARVGVQSVVELIDVVVEDSDRAPKCGILSISINGLLIRLVRFPEIARRHVCSTQQIPRERVVRIYQAVVSTATERRGERRAHQIRDSWSKSLPTVPDCRTELGSDGTVHRAVVGPWREQDSLRGLVRRNLSPRGTDDKPQVSEERFKEDEKRRTSFCCS